MAAGQSCEGSEALDFHDIDQLIAAFYATISGPAGGQDWEGAKPLFHPDARLVRTRLDEAGRPVAFSFSVDGYREAPAPLLAAMDFYAYEIARRPVRFGTIATLFPPSDAYYPPRGGRLLDS